jgi:hypothetical protein
MLVRRERTLLLVTAAVLFLAAILSVRQVLENQARHAEMREAFILSFEKGHTADAQRLYDRLKYDLPEEPTRHLINDLERTATIAPTNESASSNLLVRYHLSVKHEVQKRVQKRFLREGKEGEPSS